MRDVRYEKAEAVLAALRAKHGRLATAESCTGGGIGEALTAIAGSSDVYMGGIIAYANALKSSLLNVPPAMIKVHGAVSSDVAEAMARGALVAINATTSVSVTGVAGPGGGTEQKPVGTVFIATARRRGADITLQSQKFSFTGQTRDEVRDSTILAALDMVLAQS